MQETIMSSGRMAGICAETDPASGLDALLERLHKGMPGLQFEPVLSRGGWHRLGGVVDENYQRVSDNILQWAERESGGDVDELLLRHGDKGWFATRLAGKTHYLTAPCGDNAEDFIQLEVEELQEVLDRPLIDHDWYPESLEEFLEPLDYPRLEPEPIGRPHYLFRRITPIAELLNEPIRASQAQYNLRRFFRDWNRSSANYGEPFCRYWILALREYMDSDGECRRNPKPVSTFAADLPDLPPGDRLQGVDLANAIHHYDRRLGYPYAWYFMMLSSKAANYTLAEAVLRDQLGAYDYLPARDLKVLRDWEERPYGV